MNSTIRQVEYYREGQIFESDHDVLRIYDALEKLLSHVEMQAQLGYKFNFYDPAKKPGASYQMYYNEVVLGDNQMMVILDGVKVSLIPHTVINYMVTRDITFNENFYGYILNLMKKSTQISSVSEKERAKFFRVLRERINRRRDALNL